MKKDELKKLVMEKYSEIAHQSKEQNESSCCGATGCCGTDYTVFSESYNHIQGYNPDADLGLGCGLPTEFAQIKEGDTVVDLGSGAGNDCFIARALTGEKGRVIGIDMTEAMIKKAKDNALKLGYANVEFRLGDIEKMPMTSNIADVVISNCVLNLVPDKAKAFSEIFRILKPGGHLSVSDVVTEGELPEEAKQVAELYAGCVSGAVQLNEYIYMMKQSGLKNITVQKKRKIDIPEEIIKKNLSKEGFEKLKETGTGIYSITVYAEKQNCCNNCNC